MNDPTPVMEVAGAARRLAYSEKARPGASPAGFSVCP